MSLRQQTAANVRITFAATVVAGLVQMINLIVLARLLTPVDYGLIAGTLIAVSIVQRFVFGSVESAIVLQNDFLPVRVTSLFLIQFPTAFVAGIAFLSVALLLSIPAQLQTIFLLMTPVIVISGLCVVARAKLRRDMAFGRLAIIELVAQILGFSCVSIGLAFHGYGAKSLALGYLCQAAIQLVLLHLLSSLHFVRSFSAKTLTDIYRTAGKIVSTSSLETAQGQVTPTFVGTYFGLSSLGQFNRAFSLITLPIELITTSMSRVLYSAFRVASNDPAKLSVGCRAAIETATSITLPLCFGMAGASHELVSVFLGQKWLTAATLIPWFALGSALATTAHFLAVMNEAVGRLIEKFVIQAITTAATILAFAIAVNFDLEKCAMAYAFGGAVFLFGQVVLSATIIKENPLKLIGWIVPSLICGLLILAGVHLTRLYLIDLSPITLLVVEVAICALILLIYYPLFASRIFRQIVELSGITVIIRTQTDRIFRRHQQ